MPAAGDELRKRGEHRAVHAEHVDLDHAVEQRPGPSRGPLSPWPDAGVRDDQVESAELLHGLPDSPLHRVEVGDVGTHPDRACADRLRGALSVARVQIDDYDRRTLVVQGAGGLEADPARRTCDERHLAVHLEPLHHTPVLSLLKVISPPGCQCGDCKMWSAGSKLAIRRR